MTRLRIGLAGVLAPLLSGVAGTAAAATPALLAHQVPLALDGAATGWILTSTALVLLMTLPGLALFYGGMVRRKNVIATITQSLGVASVVTLAWFIAGYGLSFGVGQPVGGYSGDEVQSYIGSFQALFLNGVTPTTAHSLAPGLPEYLWIAYQLTFAIITPALIAGAFAERIKYSGLLLFTGLWTLLAKAEAEAKKLDEERMIKEEEAKKEAAEVEVKKAHREKASAELKAVKENLKKMGLAAVFVPMTKNGDTFNYPGGKAIVVKEKVTDSGVLQSLNSMIDQQTEKYDDDRHQLSTCSGGYETCMDSKGYILYLSKDAGGTCIREWYLVNADCR